MSHRLQVNCERAALMVAYKGQVVIGGADCLVWVGLSSWEGGAIGGGVVAREATQVSVPAGQACLYDN